MLVPADAAEPVAAVESGAIDSNPIPELGFTRAKVDAAAVSGPEPDEEEREAKERRARARRRARERRARLRTTGLVMLIVAGFFGVIASGIALVKFINRTAVSGMVTYEGRPLAT